MKKTLDRSYRLFVEIFSTAHYSWIQLAIILVISLAYIQMPQSPPVDWDLNTRGFWSDIPHTYLNNPNLVYPPWGLVLLLPYYFIQAAGARVFSVVSIGWMAYLRKWPLSRFFIFVLSPYFMVTMAKSNMDILVIVLPILLWESSHGKRWEILARGISISLLLLKPQCTVLLLIFLIWSTRKEWKKTLAQLAVAAALVIPINFIGAPPLFFQWVGNITHPSAQNQYYWSINNISLTAKFGFGAALGFLSLAAITVYLLTKAKRVSWKEDQVYSSLLLASMFLLPYTSQQSLSTGLAFIPSWTGLLVQWTGVAIGFATSGFHNNVSLWTFIVSLLSMTLYIFQGINLKTKITPSIASDRRDL